MKDRRANNKGRPPIGKKALTDEQIRERFRKKLRAEGGRSLSLRLKNSVHAQTLRKFTNESPMNFKSETAAATFLMEKALDQIARRLEKKEDSE